MKSRKDFFKYLVTEFLDDHAKTGVPDNEELFAMIIEMGHDPACMTRDQMLGLIRDRKMV